MRIIVDSPLMSIASEKTSPPDDVHAKQEHGVRQSLERFFACGWVRSLLVSLVLFALLLIPRLADLDALVTPDEPLWIARSANFYEAITNGDLRDTYQYVHPGVPIMWLGALGYYLHIPDMPDLMGGALPVRNRAVQDVLETNGYSILDVLMELRRVVIVASALVVLGLFLCLKRIANFWAAAAAVAFLALDPLHIGFTRLLHLDGLSANLIIFAVIAFSWYLQTWSKRALILTGVITGLACLTRTASAIVGPFFALIALVDIGLATRVDSTNFRPLLRQYAVALVVAGALAFIAFCAFWPAMWVAPLDTLSTLWSGSRDLAESGSDLDIYFLGHVSNDPGWRYYPVVLAHRLSGFTAVGIVIAIAAAMRPRDLGARFNRRLAAHLGTFAAVYMVILSASPKKLDRYVLPSVVALDLVAGLAWVTAAVWLGQKLIRTSTVGAGWASAALVIAVLLGQTDYASQSRPFYIGASSPLFGGVAGARDDFSFSWGEGGKEVAEALEQLPGIENATVTGGPLPATIDYYLPFRVQAPEYGSNLRTAREWMNTDYIVVSFPEIQRQLYSPKLLAWLEQQQPIATVSTKEGMYARIYDIRGVPPPDSFYSGVPKAVWDANATVLAADYPDSKKVGASSISVSLYIQTDQLSREVRVAADLVTTDGISAGSVSIDVAIIPETNGIAEVSFDIPVASDIDPKRYRIRYSFADVVTGQPLPGVNVLTGEPILGPVTIGTILIRPAG